MKNIAKTVFSVTLVTLLCRLLSFVSVQLYMSAYGAEDTRLNIFVYAYKLPDLIFTSIGATLTTVVVPLYSSLLAKGEDGRAKAFLDNIISITGLLLLLLVGLGLMIAPVFPIFSAYSRDPEQYQYAVFSLRVLMPVMFFYGMSYIFQGVLQSHNRFLLPAAVSLPSSLTVILYVVLWGERYGVTGLLFAIFLGLSLQAVILLPGVFKTGYRYSPSFLFKDEEIVMAARMMLPVLAGVSAYQLNMIFNLSMSTHFGAVALLSYVQNLLLVSVLSFVYSVTAVYYPRLTARWSVRDEEGYGAFLGETITTALFFLIPMSFGFILLRYQVFDLLARWGRFSHQDMILAGDFMGLYALGIVAMGLKEILDKGFYSQKNTKISAIMGFVIMGANVCFSLFFIRFMDVRALPLSYSVSSTIGVCGLLAVMKKKSPSFTRGVLPTVAKCFASAAIMGIAIIVELYFLNGLELSSQILTRAVRLFVPVVTGVAVYFAAAYALRIPYCVMFIQKLRRADTE